MGCRGQDGNLPLDNGKLNTTKEGRANKMAMIYDTAGQSVDYAFAVSLMDDELREQVHDEMAPCTEQEFFDRYCELHEKQFNESFIVV
jgi:hypothetical protein